MSVLQHTQFPTSDPMRFMLDLEIGQWVRRPGGFFFPAGRVRLID
jgi:hypothetical protein